MSIDLSPNFGVKIENKKDIQGGFKSFHMSCIFGGYEIYSKAVIID